MKLSNLNDPQYKHIFLFLYWVIYGIVFWYFERFRGNVVYHPVESVLDEYIPFISAFIIPYFWWFIYMIGGMIYYFFTDVTTFKKCMWFIIITYSVTLIIYFIYPTKQMLRPQLTGTGIFETVISGLYTFDTNTNVCPSIHVLGTMAICLPALKSKRLQKPHSIVYNVLCGVLISFSTVFLKQHSIIDVFWAVILCIAAYPLCISDNKLSKKLLNL